MSESINGVPYVIWSYWNGPDMSGNRALSFALLQRHIGVPVRLVTPDLLATIVVNGHPIHPAFPYLSAVHQSDYLRIYLLHHHGGGWHDIKATKISFASAWTYFSDASTYLVGRPERLGGPAKVADDAGRWMPDHWQDLVSVTAWVGRANTPFSTALYTRLHLWLDEAYARLKAHPAKHPREKYIPAKNIFHGAFIHAKQILSGRNPRYPLPWTVFGNLFHPLNYEYRDHIIRELPCDEVKNAGIYHR